ncbi:MAG: hypothetical protein ACYTF8_01005, partial [Planctomycetota bacterium]
MNTYRFLAVLGCLALLCTISSAQEAKLEQEGARAFIVVGPDQWVDLLVKVDPKGAEIDAGS